MHMTGHLAEGDEHALRRAANPPCCMPISMRGMRRSLRVQSRLHASSMQGSVCRLCWHVQFVPGNTGPVLALMEGGGVGGGPLLGMHGKIASRY
jgi:hypothetical protein